MEEIKQVVNRYLQAKDTDYAIMITGEWGCGKTYYVNNALKDYIGKKKCCVDNVDEYYKPLYISLYGISDTSDISMKILDELFPVLKYKPLLILRQGFSSFMKSKGIDRKTQNEICSFKGIKCNNILIFDDIERVNNKVDFKELLGVINQYVEHYHLKVIVICNNDKENDVFREFKEKTIRYTIKFQRSLSASYDDIISEREKNEYYSYLIKQKELIINTFQYGGCNNLRTLKFVIDAFEKVYNKVHHDKYKDEIQESLLVSFLLYTIEYKNGNDPERLKELEKLRYYIGYLDKNKDKKQEYLQELYEKYDRIRHAYNYYPVVNNYVTNGFIDDEEFDKQIKEIYSDFVRYAETPEGKLLQLFEDWKMIDDDKFATYVLELIQYIKDVKYSIRALTTLYHQLLVIEYYGIEGFKVDENLEKIFRDSAYEREHQDGFNLYLENDIYQLSYSQYREQVNDRYNSYINYIGEINRALRAAGEKDLIDGFMDALTKGDSDKITDYCNSANFQFLLENLNANDVFDLLITSNKNVVRALLGGFYNRFPDRVSGIAISSKEITFINNLKNLINDYLMNLKVKKVSSIWYHIIMNKLDSIIGQNNVVAS